MVDRPEQRAGSPLEPGRLGGVEHRDRVEQEARPGGERPLGQLVAGRLEPDQRAPAVRGGSRSRRASPAASSRSTTRTARECDDAHRVGEHLDRRSVRPLVERDERGREASGHPRRRLGRLPDAVAHRQRHRAQAVRQPQSMCLRHIADDTATHGCARCGILAACRECCPRRAGPRTCSRTSAPAPT